MDDLVKTAKRNGELTLILELMEWLSSQSELISRQEVIKFLIDRVEKNVSA